MKKCLISVFGIENLLILDLNSVYNVIVRRKVFSVWFVVFLAWAFYRANVILPEWVDEFIVKPLIFIAPVLFVTSREGKDLRSIGLGLSLKNLIFDIYIGVSLGVLFAIEGLFANYIKYGRFSFSPLQTVSLSGGIYMFLIINLITSVSEEILGRGYMYNRLYQATNNQARSAIVSSFLFLLLHVPIMFTRLHLTGSSLIFYPVSIMVMGIANSYLFTLRKTLVLPVLVHTFWNMTMALYL